MTKVRALVLTAPGSNRDGDGAFALAQAGAEPEIVSMLALTERPELAGDAGVLMFAGGFSFADSLGAGKVWGLELTHRVGDVVRTHIERGRPVIGVCNGFQALVRSGILPGIEGTAALAPNAHGRFECRWVTLQPVSQRCVWTAGLTSSIDCPVAHGEGRFLADDLTYATLAGGDQIALRYSASTYPANPNGSRDDIAGICDPTGLVLGLMPHPEDHVLPRQHPGHRRGRGGGLGLELFRRGVAHAAGS